MIANTLGGDDMAKKGESIANDSNKMSGLFQKIDKVFDIAFEKGITGNFKTDRSTGEVYEKRWSENTKFTYSDTLKGMAREISGEFGVSRIDKIVERIPDYVQNRINGYHNGNTSQAYNLHTLASAMKAFNEACERTDVFKESFKMGDPEALRATLREQNVFRSGKATTVLQATPEQCRSVLDNIRNSGYNTTTREIALHVGKISMTTGGRISAILNLKAKDFHIDRSRNEIHFIGDKGGKDNVVRIDAETSRYLERLREGKNPNERIFSSTRKTGELKGTFKSIGELRKEVTKIISDAGKHLKTTEKITLRGPDGKPKQVEVTKKFSPHSFRKSFALSRVGYYARKFDSKSSLDKYVSRRTSEDPKLKAKLDALRDRINRHRNTARDLKPSEYAIFFASVDLGHFRNDVITAFYTTFKEVEEYYGDKR